MDYHQRLRNALGEWFGHSRAIIKASYTGDEPVFKVSPRLIKKLIKEFGEGCYDTFDSTCPYAEYAATMLIGTAIANTQEDVHWGYPYQDKGLYFSFDVALDMLLYAREQKLPHKYEYRPEIADGRLCEHLAKVQY